MVFCPSKVCKEELYEFFPLVLLFTTYCEFTAIVLQFKSVGSTRAAP